MTLPDVADIMEHILGKIKDAQVEYEASNAKYNDAVARNDDILRILAAERCANSAGRMDALGELKRWIVTYEKQEPDRSEKDCMWEGDE